MINKKIILSVLVIGCIATVAGAGTWAYFEDSKTVSDNKITTGDIKLSVGDDVLTPFKVGPIYPGNEGDAKTVKLTNDGDIDGVLYAQITSSNGPDDITFTIGDKVVKVGQKTSIDNLDKKKSKSYNIHYKFANSNMDQSGEMDKEYSYTITYYLQQKL